MPENRMGNIAEAQQKLYDKARDNLRILLKEQLLAKEPKTPPAESDKPAEKEQSAAVPSPSPAQQADNPAEPQQSPAKAAETAETPVDQTPKRAEADQPLLQAPETPAEKPAETAQPADSAAQPVETAQPAEKTPETAEEQMNKSIDDELAKVPDEALYAKQVSVLNEMYHDRLDEILKSLPDGESKDKLAEILKEESYDKVRLKTKAFAAESADSDLSARFAALPGRDPEEDHLQVSYILATEPGKYRYGTVKEIETSAEVRGNEGNTVLIKVAINKEELPDLRPGATVTAKVYCGRRALGYVLLDDLISFIQTRIIFRYF